MNRFSKLANISKEEAENLAISGLVHLAAEDDLLMRFSALTGILPNDMRQAASAPAFLAGVLDFYLSHEPDLLAWCKAENLNPENIAKARYALSPQDVSGFE